MFVWTEYLQQELAVDACDHVASGDFDGVLHGAKVRLFTNNMVPSKDTLVGDLTVPTYSGYADVVASFGAPVRRDSGGIATQGAVCSFAMPDATVPTSVYGYAIIDASTPAKLLGVEMFPGGRRDLADALDIISLVPEIAFGGPDQGSAHIID